jgi:hypothetical protein
MGIKKALPLCSGRNTGALPRIDSSISFTVAKVQRISLKNKKKKLSNIKSANFRAKWALFDIIGL